MKKKDDRPYKGIFKEQALAELFIREILEDRELEFLELSFIEANEKELIFSGINAYCRNKEGKEIAIIAYDEYYLHTLRALYALPMYDAIALNKKHKTRSEFDRVVILVVDYAAFESPVELRSLCYYSAGYLGENRKIFSKGFFIDQKEADRIALTSED